MTAQPSSSSSREEACPRHPAGEAVAWLPLEDQGEVSGVRRAAVALAGQLGLGEQRISELAIVATELASNVVKHAGGGCVALRALRTATAAGVELIAVDEGPGIADVALAGVDGFSSAGTLGIGLGAIQRLSDQVEIFSLPGRGTVAAVTVWPAARDGDAAGDRRAAAEASSEASGEADPGNVAGVVRPITGETVSGDGVAWRCLPGGRRALMLVDGLGHGELAARVALDAQRAFAELLDADVADPERVLARLQRALAGGRGAAVGVAVVDRPGGTLTWAGIGNIALRTIASDGREHSQSCRPGIVGAAARSVRTVVEPIDPLAIVVLHSDGLTTKWRMSDLPGLAARPAVVVAATLLREAGLRRDDASVLVDAPGLVDFSGRVDAPGGADGRR